MEVYKKIFVGRETTFKPSKKKIIFSMEKRATKGILRT